ncbi:immunity protein YezG family protein [Nocardiopsis sp. LDBS1602]|uniref:immunity protein YezG family protein n=1 Tax=Nocardiopsis sp. LDBS1602 TaxID=3109597 RepID=UPI002DB63777|nr:immunity protein YezG family protein [Nocardiopsis sp. LDBS1602]MEC3892822.1 immunity protein YezG family protein [Nocardiopsis sp. LDBS1602]
MYGSQKGHMGPIEEIEKISEIAFNITKELPDGWVSADYYSMFMGAYGIQQIDVEKEGGEVARVSLPPSFIINTMQLRSGMYKENEGTWLSWELNVSNEGRYRSKFNYDTIPPYTFSPSDREYIRETELFPREGEHMPSWLQDKIDEINLRP